MIDMTSDWAAVIEFPAMHVGIRIAGDVLSAITYLPRSTPLRAPQDGLSERAARQIERYRDEPDADFDLPLAQSGSTLRRAVWKEISAIPRGRTRTYGDLAARIGMGDASNPRLVGQACGDNPFPIVVPCHRVVAANGLGGFSHHTRGFLIEAKTWLLRHESLPLDAEPGTLWHQPA